MGPGGLWEGAWNAGEHQGLLSAGGRPCLVSCSHVKLKF